MRPQNVSVCITFLHQFLHSVFFNWFNHYLAVPCFLSQSVFIPFRCYYCDASLHVGSYTLHRDNKGQARFYCNPHVGKERQSLKRWLGDAVDNSSTGSSRPTSMLYDSTPSASNSSHDEVNINEVTTEMQWRVISLCAWLRLNHP